MQQLVKLGELNYKNTYIQSMLWNGEKLVVKVNIFAFENKKLIKALKIEK